MEKRDRLHVISNVGDDLYVRSDRIPEHVNSASFLENSFPHAGAEKNAVEAVLSDPVGFLRSVVHVNMIRTFEGMKCPHSCRHCGTTKTKSDLPEESKVIRTSYISEDEVNDLLSLPIFDQDLFNFFGQQVFLSDLLAKNVTTDVNIDPGYTDNFSFLAEQIYEKSEGLSRLAVLTHGFMKASSSNEQRNFKRMLDLMLEEKINVFILTLDRLRAAGRFGEKPNKNRDAYEATFSHFKPVLDKVFDEFMSELRKLEIEEQDIKILMGKSAAEVSKILDISCEDGKKIWGILNKYRLTVSIQGQSPNYEAFKVENSASLTIEKLIKKLEKKGYVKGEDYVEYNEPLDQGKKLVLTSPLDGQRYSFRFVDQGEKKEVKIFKIEEQGGEVNFLEKNRGIVFPKISKIKVGDQFSPLKFKEFLEKKCKYEEENDEDLFSPGDYKKIDHGCFLINSLNGKNKLYRVKIENNTIIEISINPKNEGNKNLECVDILNLFNSEIHSKARARKDFEVVKKRLLSKGWNKELIKLFNVDDGRPIVNVGDARNNKLVLEEPQGETAAVFADKDFFSKTYKKHERNGEFESMHVPTMIGRTIRGKLYLALRPPAHSSYNLAVDIEDSSKEIWMTHLVVLSEIKKILKNRFPDEWSSRVEIG